MTREKVNELVSRMEELAERLTTDPELADRFVASIDKRVTPRQRYEKLMGETNTP